MESESESTPHRQVEEDEEGDNLRDLYLFVSKTCLTLFCIETCICFVSKTCVKVFLSHLPSWLLRVPLLDGLVEKQLDEEHVQDTVDDRDNSVEKM